MENGRKNRGCLVALVRICLQCRRPRFETWLGKIPWRREQLPTPVFSSGESHGQISLVGYSPWGSQRVTHDWASFNWEWKQFMYVKTYLLYLHTTLCVDFWFFIFSSVAQSCPTLCDPMNRSMPGLSVHHKLPEFTQTHVHWVSDAIQPSHPLSSPSPPAPNPSQHQGLFQWVNSSCEVAKVLEFQLQHQSFQRTPRADLL